MFPHLLSQAIAQRHRVPLPPSDTSRTDFELIAALLLRSPTPSASDNNDEQDDEDGRRAATILLLRLAYAQAHTQLSSIAQELELLRSAPAPALPGTSDRANPSSSEEEHALWRLDAPARGSGPLLDSTGKVAHDLLRFSYNYLMLIWTCLSRCSHSRYCPLAQAATVQGSETRCSRRITACRPCRSTNTSRLSGSAATFSLEEGKKTP